jgi:UDP-glucose 4-epimerase
MELGSKNILVTGGAGFIGSHLVDALVRYRRCRVRVLDDLSTGEVENLSHHLEANRIDFVRGDLCDQDVVGKSLEGIEVVFHLACRGVRHSIGRPIPNHDVNATGTLLLLEQARRTDVARFVHVSSSEVYGSARRVPMDEDHPCFPETVYGAAKLAGDCYARAYHQTYRLPTVVVRPFNNFGPRSHFEGDAGEVIPRFAVWALNGKAPLIFGDGLQTRDFIYVEDTAYWLCRIAECDFLVGQTINLGSGQETSVRDLAAAVYRETARPEVQAEFRPPRPGDVRRHLADVTRARNLLGFAPRTNLTQGVRRLMEFLRAREPNAAVLLRQMEEVNWKDAA